MASSGTFELFVDLVGHLAWPVAGGMLVVLLLRELKSGLLQKILKDGGSVEVWGAKVTVAAVEGVKIATASANVQLVKPIYLSGEAVDAEEALTPYEKVMTAWAELASGVVALAVGHGGFDDQRRARENVELLGEKGIMDAALQAAIRSAQSARNSIRGTGPASVGLDAANSYAETAYSLRQAVDALGWSGSRRSAE